MTNWQKSFEPEEIKLVTLKKGTFLFHGTDSIERFSELRGPAWLCETMDQASEWYGWSDGPMSGGKKRILRFVVTRNLELVDTTTLEQWQNLFMKLCRTPDPLIGQAAKAVAKAKLRGWYGKREVMVVSPPRFLAPAGLAWSAK